LGRSESKIMEGAAPFLEDGEDVLAAVVARPRGWTQAGASAGGGALAGAIGGHLGGKKMAKNTAAAEDAGFELANPMSLAVTQRRLLCFKLGAVVGMGVGGDVKELVSAVPLSAVDSIESKRLGLGRTITATVGGTPFTVEVGAGANAKGVVSAFESARAVT
jgi:hypothetical protein